MATKKRVENILKTNKSAKKQDKNNKSNSRDRDYPIWAEDYLDCFSFTYKPVTESFINRFFQDMVTYFRDNEDAMQLERYYLQKGVRYDNIKKWCDKWPQAKAAYEMCLQIAGTRRELGAMTKDLDGSFVNKTLYNYLEMYRTSEEWRSSLRQKEAEKQSSSNYTVVMEPFPESDLVPEKKKPTKTTKTPEEVAKEASREVKNRRKNVLP